MYEGQTITEKEWNINYDSGDKEDITKLMTRQNCIPKSTSTILKLIRKNYQHNLLLLLQRRIQQKRR